MWTHADRIIGLLVIGSGVLLAVAVAGTEINAQQLTLSARFFPALIAGALILLGIGLAIRPGPLKTADVLTALAQRRAIWVGALFLVYALTFRDVDFRFGTWAFVLLTMWILGARKPLELVAVPIAVSGTVFVIFRFGFVVLLPTWT